MDHPPLYGLVHFVFNVLLYRYQRLAFGRIGRITRSVDASNHVLCPYVFRYPLYHFPPLEFHVLILASTDDAGHTGITGNRWKDRAIAATIASYLSGTVFFEIFYISVSAPKLIFLYVGNAGISIGWWVDQHDVHHRKSAFA